jgi:hypothetical protein
MAASKASFDDAGKVVLSGVTTAARCASRVDHEPDQTVENMQRDEKLWRSQRIFREAGTRRSASATT